MGAATWVWHQPGHPRWLRRCLAADTGSLYPALHRLERAKWITAEWKKSENQQNLKVYRLTAAGKKQLLSERSRWEQLVHAIGGILGHEQP